MTKQPIGYHPKAVAQTNEVLTYRAKQLVTQRHRGYTGWVYIEGHRKPFKTGTFHQKAGRAKEAAAKLGRWLLKDPANVDYAIERGWQAK